MIDLQTHCIIDLIDSRQTEDVSKWLKQYPNIKIVVRDGSIGYRAAINDAHPNAIQINDRFHMMKNLIKAITKTLQRIIVGRIEIPLTSESSKLRYEYLTSLTRRERILEAKQLREKGISYAKIASQLNVSTTTATKYVNMKNEDVPKEHISTREKEHIDAVNKLNVKVKQVKDLHSQGMPVNKISKSTGYNINSINMFISNDFNPVHGQYGVSRSGLLEPYRDEVIGLRAKNITYKEITKIISKKGYTGSVAALRGFIIKEKRITKDLLKDKEPSELIDKRWVTKLLYKSIDEVKQISQEQLDEVIKLYPILEDMLSMLSEFRDILTSKDLNRFLQWIVKCSRLKIKEIDSYLSGLNGDYASVTNAIIYKYNNGLAEGSVNKLKNIKRIMYGRNGFELLRHKVLQLEALKN